MGIPLQNSKKIKVLLGKYFASNQKKISVSSITLHAFAKQNKT